jgi:hypothetical protein
MDQGRLGPGVRIKERLQGSLVVLLTRFALEKLLEPLGLVGKKLLISELMKRPLLGFELWKLLFAHVDTLVEIPR